MEHHISNWGGFLRLVTHCDKEMRLGTELKNRALQNQAVATTRLLNFLRYIYTERKSLLVFAFHFILTMTVWGHFFFTKYEIQRAMVPEEANRYWLKRLIPPLEFGAMHAILFQMSLLPFTMSRVTMSYLQQNRVLRSVLPFNRVVDAHIHLGYVMVGIVFLATIVFFTFFGIMCQEQKDGIEPKRFDGALTWCEKFTSEIMCTGYGILGSLLIVAYTSYRRNTIPYEIFYLVHHLVFVMFALATAHTLDVPHMRGDKERSQTFKWFSFSLWLYVTDRFYAYTCRTYKLKCNLNASYASSNPTTASRRDAGIPPVRCVLFRVPRPVQFAFSPGQWAYLHVPSIDPHWHPFSIGSDPGAPDLEFMIEVKGRGSWSEKLWLMVSPALDDKGEPMVDIERAITVEIQGPFGTSLTSSRTNTQILGVGGGSGIVPMLSMLRRNTAQLCQLDRCGFYKANRLQKDAAVKMANEYSARHEVWVVVLNSLMYMLHVTFLPKLFQIDKKLDESVAGFIKRRRDSTSVVNANRHSVRQMEAMSPQAKSQARINVGGEARPAVPVGVHPTQSTVVANGKRTFSIEEEVAGRLIQQFLINRALSRALDGKTQSALLTRIHKDFRSVLGHFAMKVCYVGLPCWGLVCLACTWSFHTHVYLGTELREWMVEFLKIGSFIGVTGFGIYALNQKAASLMVAVDVSVATVATVACVLWTRAEQWGGFDDPAMAAYMLFGFYMLFRYWADAVSEKGIALVQNAVELMSGTIFVPECFDLVWTTRSAAQVVTLLPALEEQCAKMHYHWTGKDKRPVKGEFCLDTTLAHMVQRVSVYVTDTDEAAVAALKEYAVHTCKFVDIYYHRPNFSAWLQNHSQRLVTGDSFLGARMTLTMLAFCGSSSLGAHLDSLRQETLWTLEMLGARSHRITFEQENFGHSNPPKKATRTWGGWLTGLLSLDKKGPDVIAAPVIELADDARQQQKKEEN